MEKLITHPILAWIVGHNHLPIEYNRRYYLSTGYAGNVLFVSNPRGKPKKPNDDTNDNDILYRKDMVLRLTPNVLEDFQTVKEETIPDWVKKNKI